MSGSLSGRKRIKRALLFAALRVPRAARRPLIGPLPVNDRGDPLDEDTAWLLFLERLGPGIARGTPASARRRTRASAAIAAPRVQRRLTAIDELTLAGCPARLYHPGGTRRPVLLYLHGGGWTVGDLDTHDALCRRLADDTGWIVVALDYPLAPEHPFPAAVDATSAALRELRARAAELGGDPGTIAVGGDSAGGNLAAVACQVLRDAGEPLPVGQVLIYPATDLRRVFPSHDTFARGFFLERKDVDWYLAQYGGDELDPRGSPLLARSLAGLPQAIVVTAGFDPLRDEGEAYASALLAAGVHVVRLDESRLIHGFVNMDAVIPAADAAVGRIVAAIRAWAH